MPAAVRPIQADPPWAPRRWLVSPEAATRRCRGNFPGGAGWQEADYRSHRRIWAAAPGVPAAQHVGKTSMKPSSTTESPWRCGSNWTNWPRVSIFVGARASPCCPSAHCPGPGDGQPVHAGPACWANVTWKEQPRPFRPLQLRPTVWYRNCSPISAIWTCRSPDAQAGQASTSCSSTTWATCPRAPRSLRGPQKPLSPNATGAPVVGHPVSTPGLLRVGALRWIANPKAHRFGDCAAGSCTTSVSPGV